jgi:glutamyl-tRNA reductase
MGDAAKLLLLVGSSYKQTPVELRERLHVGPQEAGEVAASLAGAGEAVVLATCNRVEIYVADTDPRAAQARIVAEFARRAGVSGHELAPSLHVTEEHHAAQHLFRVTAGLESLVRGEPQILGQVREAQRLADAANSLGPVLNRLFGHAIHNGRRVRAETQIAASSSSVAEAAAQLVRQHFGELRGRRILIIGAGKIGGLAAATLVSSGVQGVFAGSRGLESAAALARRFGGDAIAFDQVPVEIERADVIISCTRSPQPVLDVGQVAAALPRRGGAPLVLIDLAVPRDLDPEIANLPGCALYDVDDLGAGAQSATAPEELRRAETIVAEEVARFEAWRRALRVAPEIASLRRRAEEIRVTELAGAEGKLAALSPDEWRAVEVVTAQIVNKLLHLPTVRVKQAADPGDHAHYAAALRHLFALEDVA